MNVWNWVWDKQNELNAAGHERLAEFIERISSDTCDNKHEAVDNYADEAIQMAKDAREPWVELFLRHWRLQSTVLHRQMPKQMVREAVSLIEFSHRPENADCPQGVCAVQDLTACYRAYDGPGYYKERMDACKETLDKITPRWSCFGCISAEYIYALYDNGDYAEALKKLEWVDNKMELSGRSNFDPELDLIRALIFIRLSKFEQAERTLKRFSSTSKVFKLHARVYEALSSAVQQNCNKALQQLPAANDIQVKSDVHTYWVEVIWLCAHANSDLFTTEHLQQCAGFLAHAEDRGAYRQALTMGAMVARLAILAGNDASTAGNALDTMKRVQNKLKEDLGASELISDISKEVERQ